ncbi:hypothetical protein ACKWTF_010111 [Chironomus riparius]
MTIILKGSRIMKDLPYKTILCIVLKQIFDYPTNSYKKELPEELKIAVFKCFEAASTQLEFDVIEKFMVNENKILLGQCIFICKEAISKETYLKLRKSAIEALMALTQCHDKFDQNDCVLKEQISKILFIVLPQIATVLIKVCQEDCLRGPSLIQVALKCLGRFLCLILEDYDKKNLISVKNEDFLKLIQSGSDQEVAISPKVTKQNVEKLEKSKEWMATTSQNLSKIIINLKSLRGSEYVKIRHEFAVLSFNLLCKCQSNCKLFMRFLLENLILFTDDFDENIQKVCQDGLKELTAIIPNINKEISDLFSIHLATMPRIILTGLESEQYAGIALINSYLKIFSNIEGHLEGLFENPMMLEKFINIMISCSEIDAPKELIFHETAGALSDEFYKMKMPWKHFKNLKNESIAQKFSSVCKNIGSSRFSQVCVNYLLDNINSIEYLVFLNEILNCEKQKLSLSSDQLDSIMEEFLNETYWSFPTKAVSQVPKKAGREEWFEDHTPGLYESAIEVKLTDISLNDNNEEQQVILNLKTIKYNILCTCTILEMTGNIALKLESKFQKYILRCLHMILEKAGNSNFLIKSAGLYALQCISQAMGHTEISQLIDANSDYLLFNIHKLLRHDHENEAIIDMMSVVFKYSKASITAYVEDIVEMAANHIINAKFSQKTASYLKLFKLYVESVRQWSPEIEMEVDVDIETDWDEFYRRCLHILENGDDIDMQINNEHPEQATEEPKEDPEENEQQPETNEVEKTPQHIELTIKILTSSLPYFASSNPTEVILVHEIFQNGFSVLHFYEKEFLPLVHQMWYPFTKQINGKDYVILQYSVRLLSTIAKYAKDFVYKRSTDNVITVINKFLNSSFSHTNKKENLSYTQEFKLQKEVLEIYGQISVDLGIVEKEQDEIIDILMMYHNQHSNSQLKSSAKKSIDAIAKFDPFVIKYKLSFQ